MPLSRYTSIAPPGTVNVLSSGARGDGSTNDTTAINAAIGASSGAVLVFPPGTYVLSAPLDGAIADVHLLGVGTVTVKRIAAGTNSLMDARNTGPYAGWTVENITFDANTRAAGGSPNIPLYLNNARDLRFLRCQYRDLNYAVGGPGMTRLSWDDCDFWGTRSGMMAAATQAPAAVAAAAYTDGLRIDLNAQDVEVRRSRFHFCAFAINGAATAASPARRISIHEDTRFRLDWWDGPYPKQRFTATAYNAGTRVLTNSGFSAGTGFSTHAANYEAISFRYAVGSGSAFTSIDGGAVILPAGITGMQAGDVFETADGRRASILAVTDTTHVAVSAWEAIDTYEPTAKPANATAFRVSRYYAAHSDKDIALSTTTVGLGDPFNVFNSRRAVADDGLDLTTMDARILAKSTYPINLSFAHDALVEGCHVRGGIGDQISIFDSNDPIVAHNRIEYGDDEAVTLTRCPRPKLIGNTMRYQGAGTSITGGNGSITGNTFDTWNVAQIDASDVYGAIAISGDGYAIEGNAFTRDSNMTRCAKYAISVNTTAGTMVKGNTDNGSRTSTLVVLSGVTGLITDLPAAAITYSGGTAASLSPLAIPTMTAAQLPTASSHTGKVLYVSDSQQVQFSNGTSWANIGGGVAGLVRLGQTTLGSAAASIAFSSIDQTYRNLLIEIAGVTAEAANTSTIGIRFNTDTASHYLHVFHQAASGGGNSTGTQASPTTYGMCGVLTGSTPTSPHAGVSRIEIPAYSLATLNKLWLFHSVAVPNDTDTAISLRYGGGTWISNAAITTVTIIVAAGSNLAAGTTATLYGLT